MTIIHCTRVHVHVCVYLHCTRSSILLLTRQKSAVLSSLGGTQCTNSILTKLCKKNWHIIAGPFHTHACNTWEAYNFFFGFGVEGVGALCYLIWCVYSTTKRPINSQLWTNQATVVIFVPLSVFPLGWKSNRVEGESLSHKWLKGSLIPRPHPAFFQRIHKKSGRAWYLKSRTLRTG